MRLDERGAKAVLHPKEPLNDEAVEWISERKVNRRGVGEKDPLLRREGAGVSHPHFGVRFTHLHLIGAHHHGLTREVKTKVTVSYLHIFDEQARYAHLHLNVSPCDVEFTKVKGHGGERLAVIERGVRRLKDLRNIPLKAVWLKEVSALFEVNTRIAEGASTRSNVVVEKAEIPKVIHLKRGRIEQCSAARVNDLGLKHTHIPRLRPP